MVIFEQVEFQRAAAKRLRAAYRSQRFAHAHIFWGPEGVGKLRTALGLAQMLVCQGDEPPCGECEACRKVERMSHPDVRIVLAATPVEDLRRYVQTPHDVIQELPGASIGIDRIRDLRAEAAKASVERGRRVLVIREAERMTEEAAQAALKTIEEPSEETYIVLTTTDPSRILPTIRSRCQSLRFAPLPEAFIASVVSERLSVGPEEARLAAALSGGSLSRAIGLAESGVLEVREEAISLFCEPADSAEELLGRTEDLAAAGKAVTERLLQLVGVALQWYRDVAAVACGLGQEMIMNRDRMKDLGRMAASVSVQEVRRRLDLLESLGVALDANVNPALALRSTLMEIHLAGS